MRMRQLGKGQSLTFIASSEVHTILSDTFFVKENTNSALDYVSGILNWTLSYTIKTIMDLIPYNMRYKLAIISLKLMLTASCSARD